MISKQDYAAVMDRHPAVGYQVYRSKDHWLGCLTVAEWVREARAGWPGVPKAPSPKVAAERGERLAAKHPVEYAQLTLT